jgi:hypothetical protein
MKLAAYLAVLSVAVFAAALADEPQPPAAQPAAAQSVVAPAATPAKVEKAVAIDKVATEALIKTMRARGYKPVNRNGTLVFCRAEGELGTHFQRTRCNTLDELKQAELTGKEYVNSIQQQGSPTPFLGP